MPRWRVGRTGVGYTQICSLLLPLGHLASRSNSIPPWPSVKEGIRSWKLEGVLDIMKSSLFVLYQRKVNPEKGGD